MLNKSLIQGSLSMLILRLLDEKDMYGYEMIETLRSRSENVFELKAYTLLTITNDPGDARATAKRTVHRPGQ